jgi:hypothetical protein
VDANIGAYSNLNIDGLVVTNDIGLTQIFQDFNVRKYELYPDSEELNYSLVCSCDAQVLKTELNNYTSVIGNVADVNYYHLLSIDEEEHLSSKIYPNPFEDKVSVQVNKPLDSIILYDVLGKLIYESSSISHFEDFSTTLKSGVYILKLLTEDGESMTKKLIKS